MLAVVRKFVDANPSLGFDQIEAAFPDRLQAESPIQFAPERGTVAMLKDLPPSALNRYFVGSGDVLQSADERFVVSSQWNLHNIRNFLDAAATLGFDVKPLPASTE